MDGIYCGIYTVVEADHFETYSSLSGTLFGILLGAGSTWVQVAKILLSVQDDHLWPR